MLTEDYARRKVEKCADLYQQVKHRIAEDSGDFEYMWKGTISKDSVCSSRFSDNMKRIDEIVNDLVGDNMRHRKVWISYLNGAYRVLLKYKNAS